MMIVTEEKEKVDEAASGSDDSTVSLSALVPETTLQEAEGEPGEVTSEVTSLSTSARARGECSPPRAEEKIPVEFPCPECSLSFNLKIRLNRHLKNHAKKREMMSTMIQVKAESMSPSKLKTPTSKKISVKAESTSKKPRAPKNHIEPPPGEGVACPDCGKRFRSRGPMLRHFEDLHQPGEYPCRGCGRVFTSKNKVSSHFSRNCKSRMSL